jgi:hypothetical protein
MIGAACAVKKRRERGVIIALEVDFFAVVEPDVIRAGFDILPHDDATIPRFSPLLIKKGLHPFPDFKHQSLTPLLCLSFTTLGPAFHFWRLRSEYPIEL